MVKSNLLNAQRVYQLCRVAFLLFACLNAAISSMLFAQQSDTVAVTGVVMADGEPVIGAAVLVKGTSIGTVTNIDGKFSFNVSPKATLVVSYVGYETLEIPILGKKDLHITLKEKNRELDEIVVVGYGTQKKVNLTGAVSTVEIKELENKPVINLVEAMQGTTPGLIIEQSTSTPGSRPRINIRGLSTMNNNDPLVLIDGIIGDIQNVAIGDIEHISVLKDAASTAMYGSRASNGIILITTKKGQKNESEVRYDFNYGWQKPTDYPQVVDSWIFAEMYNEAQVNSGNAPKYTAEDIYNFRNGGPNHKWLDEIFQTGGMMSHNISFSGGNDKTTLLISAGYLSQESMFVGPDYGLDRYNARINASHEISNNFKIAVTAAYTRNQIKSPAKPTDQIIRQSVRMPPFYPTKDEDGNWTTPSGSNANALARLWDGGFVKDINDELSATITAEVKIWDELKFSAMAGGKLVNKQGHTNSSAISYPTPGAGDAVSSIAENLHRTEDITTNMMLTYDKTFGKHTVSGVAGYSYESEKYRWFSTSRTLDESKYDVIGDAQKGDDIGNSGGGNDWALYSVFGRINYNYDQRYLFEFNIRNDMSSKFRKGNRSGIFPSLSAAWRISEEKFYSESLRNIVPYLKIRGSWGLVGNDRIGLYQYMANVSINQSYMFGGELVNTSNFASSNPDLKWETTRMVDVGIDLSFRNNVNITFDYYNNLTKDILVNLPVSYVFGSDAPLQNASKVKTWGWDLGINYNLALGEVHQRFAFNISDSQNKVVDNKGRVDISSGDMTTIIKEGYPLWSYYGYRSDGFFQNQAEVDKGPHLDGVTPKPGDIRYVDKNGDGKIKEDDDRFVLGNRYPRYTFGFNYAVNWKNFDFSMFWQGVGKRSVWINGVASEAFANSFEGPVFEYHLDRWTPNNPDASYPRLTMGAESKNNAVKSDFWIDNAAYLRLKNIQLGYTIPQHLTQKVFIENLRIYVSLQNAYTFSKMKGGWDPEVSQNNASVYPVSRVTSIGLNVKF